MDALDQKLVSVFDGKVVRKDLLHRIKKGTNVPTFVLEFLLARYCASDEPAEIQAGMEAVLATLQDNYVRPDEANAAQSKVATKGKHRFIDKVHVRYVEKEKRHWAALENFNSQRIAIGERFYRDNDRLLEGGIWAEVTIAHNDMDADDYAFYLEELRPIQLSRFDFDHYAAGRQAFTRDEWLDAVLRSVGLEPSKLSPRLKLHFIARLAPLVEANFNFIELGPRGTGKSYFFSEFSPYSTLLSGGQATKAILFYNNAAQAYWSGRLLGHGGLRRSRRHQNQGPRHDPDHEGLHGQWPLLPRGRGDCRRQSGLCGQPRLIGRAGRQLERSMTSSSRCRRSLTWR